MDGPPSSPLVRVSDSEREQVAVLLRDAVVEGRLTLEEFTERVGRVHVARTEGDLASLTDDLQRAPAWPAAERPRIEHRALFSHLVHRGQFAIGPQTAYRSIFATIELDLRQATLASPVVEIQVRNIFGTVTILLPEGTEVAVTGSGLFASVQLELAAVPPPAGAPLVRVRTSGIGGTLRVRSREPRRLVKRLLAALDR